jgi:antitoxin MazE
MGIHIRKWGNSAAVRLPAGALERAGLSIDDPVEVREEEGRIVIERAEPQAITLDWLLEDLKPEQLHGEIDFGPPVGREFW